MFVLLFFAPLIVEKGLASPSVSRPSRGLRHGFGVVKPRAIFCPLAKRCPLSRFTQGNLAFEDDEESAEIEIVVFDDGWVTFKKVLLSGLSGFSTTKT